MPDCLIRSPHARAGARRLLAVCLAAWAGYASCAVTEVYRWQEQDGTPVFSDVQPPEGVAYTVRRIQTAPLQHTETEVPGAPAPCEHGAIAAAASSHREDVAEREAHLARAREQLRAGQEPLPGERMANVGGGSRLLPSYFKRQESLEARVRHAEVGLRDARRRQVEGVEQLALLC